MITHVETRDGKDYLALDDVIVKMEPEKYVPFKRIIGAMISNLNSKLEYE